MFVIDRYAYNNRWTDVPELNKFILFIILMVISFSSLTNTVNCYYDSLNLLYC